ncbi:MAG: hypothetical protein ATN35_05310 [Epulopiscium sp. Nele67-Bin004]|nr:MAG: hypothetical protein ATN35_05310 [Epulopiscium sp. Nele67-Bin004]
MSTEQKEKILKLVGIAAIIVIILASIYYSLVKLTGIEYSSFSALRNFIFIAIGAEIGFTILQKVIMFSLQRSDKITDFKLGIIKYSLCFASNYVPLWIANVFSSEVYIPFKGIIILGTLLAVLETGISIYLDKRKNRA